MRTAIVASITLLVSLSGVTTVGSATDEAPEHDDLKAVVSDYHLGFVTSNPELTSNALSDEFFMMNGNHSDDATAWQAHMYVADESVGEWIDGMIEFASPHENDIRFVSFNVRGDSALVVTDETGRNKFRSWEDERVVYFLGRNGDEWKLVGLYIRNIANPD